MRNRLYDPATRAFVAPDPLPGVPGSAVATNPYHYANNDPVGMVDPLGLQPLSIDQYNDLREQETGIQWGNIAMGALLVGSFFIPGGPIIATLVGAGMGMAPGIIQGISTGNWDAGAIIKGGLVGGITGRVGFAFGGASSTLGGAMLRGGAGGATTGVLAEGYDMLPLPGSDGQFDLENAALETVIGAGTGGMGHRFNDNGITAPPIPSGADNIANGPRLRDQLLYEEAASVFTPTGGLHPDVIAGSRMIIPGQDIANPRVVSTLTADGSDIADWGKYSTQTYQSPSGDFQVHYYQNQSTGDVNYDIDYKAKFN